MPRIYLSAGSLKVRNAFRKSSGTLTHEEQTQRTNNEDRLGNSKNYDVVAVVDLVRQMAFLEVVGINRGQRPFRLLTLALSKT